VAVQLVVFDLDGTIIDSAPGIAATANAALAEFSYPPLTSMELAGFIGPPLRESFAHLSVDPDHVDDLVLAYRRHYAGGHLYNATVYDGVEQLFSELRARGIRVAVATAKQERFAVRIKDPENPARKAFHGVPRFPVDPALRVVADFEPYATPQVRAIPTVLGTTEAMTAPGLLRFKVGGQERTLEPLLEDPDHPELFLIFRDTTSTQDTYPAGRFLYAEMPKDGKVVLDFNKAENPPCAFTLFATCPLPPKQNQLDIPIRAGEKDPGLH